MALVILHRLSESAQYPLPYEAFCTHCHKSLGRFDAVEVSHMINDVPLGAVLCYDCEELRLREILAGPNQPILSPAIKLMLVDHGFI